MKTTGRTKSVLLVAILVICSLVLLGGEALAGPNNYSAFTSGSGPLTADGSQQTVATVTTAQSAGGATVTSFTILLGGTIGAGDVTGVYFTNGANTWSATGSYGSGSSVVCTGSAKPGASSYSINVTLAGSAAGKTVSVQVTTETPSSGGTGIPTAVSSALNIQAPPPENSYGTLSSAGGPLTANGSQQTVATVPVTPVNGGETVSSYTVNLSGTVTAGDVTGVYVTDGTNTWSSTGSYGNGSSVVCTGANAAPGATLTIRVTLAGTADTKTVGVTLQTDSNAAATLPKGPSTALLCSAPAGPPSTLTDCASCHDYPPADSATRGTPAGAIVGDHQVHLSYTCNFCHVVPATEASGDFAHRNGQINMKAATIGDAASGDNGSYSKGANFAQTNSPTTGTCSNVDCHNNNVTPQWGVGTTTCSSCHSAPPATGAHAAHYTAKGWGASDPTGTYCSSCHPGDHDGLIEVNAALTPGGSGLTTTCSTAGAGCHFNNITPQWGAGAISCTNCHTATGAPTSGLHDETPIVSGVMHNPSDPNFTGCEDCHTANPSLTHWDGTLDTPSTFAAGVGYSAGAPATCTASACHSDGGAWQRKWHENSDLTDGTQCAGCHGDWTQGWNTGVTHRTDANPRATHGTGTNYECKDCHALEAATGYTFTNSTQDWGSEGSTHGNNLLNINNNGPSFARGTGGNNGLSGCLPCHGQFDGTTTPNHSFVTTSWTLTQVSGDTVNAGCDSCHGGSGDYFPIAGGVAYPKRPGRHLEHMTQLATKIGYGAYPWTDAEQKHMCEYCHNDAAGVGGSGHNTNSGDSIADVGGFNPIWNIANPPVTADDGTFATANQTCSNVDCHNNKATTAGTFGWRDAGTSTCTMCHVGGTTDPTSGLHTGVPSVSGVTHDSTLDASGCVICHTATPSSAHMNGTADTSSPTITLAGAVGFTDGTTPTCTASACHSDGGAWQRKWHANATAAVSPTSQACAGCHGTFTTGFNTGVGARHQTTTTGDAGGQIQANHDGTATCVTCHAYDGADTYGHKWATHHLDGKIQISDQASFVDNGATVGCSACHVANDGTADGQHSFTDSSTANGWSTVSRLVAGPVASCTSCHNGGGSQQFKVGPASSHTDPDGTGGTYASGVGNCEVCHFDGHGTRTTGTIAVTWDARTMGTDYTADAKIYLKKLAGTETYEAEICWNCHWGTNMPSQGTLIKEFGATQGAYQTGTLNQRNWFGATWTSANFSAYKNNTIQSMHQAKHATIVDPARDTSEAATDVANLGCTSCHDVHKIGNNGYTPVAAPYLRGNWTSNPFKEDGAPLTGQTMSSDRGAVPRGIGSKAANGIGGWQIEQNNATFASTTYSGATGFGGICANCHTQATLQTKWSGHTGAVSGFAGGATGNNFFQVGQRGGGTAWNNGNMSYAATATGRSGTWIGGLRNARQWSDGVAPQDIDSLQIAGATITYPAGAVTTLVFDSTTQQQNFHNFPCSKCHSPHASRLPRLMITNCLDVKHNTWDNGQGNPSTWAGSPGSYTAKQLAYSPTAQNCHRYVLGTDANRDAGAEAGWNALTPWL